MAAAISCSQIVATSSTQAPIGSRAHSVCSVLQMRYHQLIVLVSFVQIIISVSVVLVVSSYILHMSINGFNPNPVLKANYICMALLYDCLLQNTEFTTFYGKRIFVSAVEMFYAMGLLIYLSKH